MSALEDLVIDTREADPDLIASLLAPFLRIDRASAHIVPQEAWNRIPNDVRVLLFLIARKAMLALALPLPREAATAVEIERGADLPAGAARPIMKRLLRQRLVQRAPDGGYAVPNYALIRIRGLVKDWLEEPSP
ncbi:MAG TPA: hypothetical protein VIO14_10855 [Dehalococcoidia bacterium]